jgi:propanol-preferring alcohol dehydrogenase
MQAMVLRRAGEPLVLETVPRPVPESSELLIRVAACGVCRSDLHIVDGELLSPKLPLIPGHEIVGEVVALGDGVDPSWLGARVGVPWLGKTCGDCWYCWHARENLCETPQFTGYTRDGGYAEYVVAEAAYCFRLPQELDDAAAAPLLCAGLIGYRTLRMAGEAERVGIYGFGAAAHIVAQVARHQGRRIFAFTRPGDTAAQEFALRLGAVWSGGSDEAPPELLDAALIFAPVGSLIPTALRAVRKGGVVVCGSIHMSDIPSFPYELLWGERAVRSVANLTRQDGDEFLALAPRVPVQTSVMTFSLDQANEALGLLRSGSLEGAAVLVPRFHDNAAASVTVSTVRRESVCAEAETDIGWDVAVLESPRDPHLLAHVLVEELGLQPNDALIRARHAPGLLSEHLSRTDAERLALRLREESMSAIAIDTSTLPDFYGALVSHHVRCGVSGLELLDLRGDLDRTIPWTDIVLIGVGLVPLESTRRIDLDDTRAVTTARRTHHRPTQSRLPPVMEAWLLMKDRLVVRFDQTRMNYESLGVQKSDSASDNFHRLLEEIFSRVPGGVCSTTTTAWSTRAPMFQYLFESSAHLQRATLLDWLKQTLKCRSNVGD